MNFNAMTTSRLRRARSDLPRCSAAIVNQVCGRHRADDGGVESPIAIVPDPACWRAVLLTMVWRASLPAVSQGRRQGGSLMAAVVSMAPATRTIAVMAVMAIVPFRVHTLATVGKAASRLPHLSNPNKHKLANIMTLRRAGQSRCRWNLCRPPMGGSSGPA
jgi:hypothetical protein